MLEFGIRFAHGQRQGCWKEGEKDSGDREQHDAEVKALAKVVREERDKRASNSRDSKESPVAGRQLNSPTGQGDKGAKGFQVRR